jgi:osmoprotectant transport system permease protein
MAGGEARMSGTWAWLTDPAHWQGPDGIPTRLVQHLVISGLALLIACAVALPLGIWLGHRGRGGFLAVNVGNAGRAIPTFGVLIILASWEPVGVGDLAAILALALFAIPPILTNTYVGLREVDPDIKDAARGMGMTGGQQLRRVELPLARPLVFAGLGTSTVQTVATATLAALVAGGGLGRFIVDGFALQDYPMLYGGTILVAALCITIELVLRAVQHRLDPLGRATQVHAMPELDEARVAELAASEEGTEPEHVITS